MENINNIFDSNTLYKFNLSKIIKQENLIEGNLEAELVVFYIPDDEKKLDPSKKEFMFKMLGAVKHNLENTLLISSESNVSFKQVVKMGFAKKIMFFGNTRNNVKLNLNIKRYKIFSIQNIECLFIDHLGLLIEDKKRKSALWTLMKVMFNIA